MVKVATHDRIINAIINIGKLTKAGGKNGENFWLYGIIPKGYLLYMYLYLIYMNSPKVVDTVPEYIGGG